MDYEASKKAEGAETKIQSQAQTEDQAQAQTEAQGKREEAKESSGRQPSGEETKGRKLTAQYLSFKSVTLFTIINQRRIIVPTFHCTFWAKKILLAAGCWEKPPPFFQIIWERDEKSQF